LEGAGFKVAKFNVKPTRRIDKGLILKALGEKVS
jgi:hypothetical protein